jgi:heme exporter protein A
MSALRGSVDVLDVERLAARRGYVSLFTGLGFSVAGGETLSIAGPNGSGKTTLLRIVAGLTSPAEGEVRWRRQAVRPFDPRIRNAVAFNGHLPALKDELTAQENLAIAVALDERPAAVATIAAALDAVALGRQKALPVRVLSQGQRRRIGLARLHLSKRPLWILDEPLTALDADGIGVLGALLEHHLEGGGLCVAASHQPLPVAASKLRSITLGATATA